MTSNQDILKAKCLLGPVSKRSSPSMGRNVVGTVQTGEMLEFSGIVENSIGTYYGIVKDVGHFVCLAIGENVLFDVDLEDIQRLAKPA